MGIYRAPSVSIEDNEARKWSIDSMRKIITTPKSEDDLEKQWQDWNSMPLDQQVESNRKSLELYGKNNKDRYEEMLSSYLKRDVAPKKDDEFKGDDNEDSQSSKDIFNDELVTEGITLQYAEYCVREILKGSMTYSQYLADLDIDSSCVSAAIIKVMRDSQDDDLKSKLSDSDLYNNTIDGSDLLYEDVNYKPYQLNKYLKNYIELKIIPEYENFDGAHGVSHVEKVIQSALYLGKQHNLDLNIVYAAAAYHDLGLMDDRETHHIHSADIVKADTNLTKWFTADDIELISQACFDHRASSEKPPKTIYGKVIADADKTDSTNIKDMFRRSYTYNLAKNPNWDDDKLFEEVYAHLKGKYGKNGYAKLHLRETENLLRADRKEAEATLQSRTASRKMFDVVTYDINNKNVDKDAQLFGHHVSDYEYYKNIDNERALKDHGHEKLLPNTVEFAFHNDHNFRWSTTYKHSSDSSDNKEYEILHYKDGKHIINKPYCLGHGLGANEKEKAIWYTFTEEVPNEKGWFYMSSGVEIDAKDVPEEYKEMMVKWHKSLHEKNRIFKEEAEDDIVDFDDIKYPPEAGETAKLWALHAMRSIVRPRDELTELERDWASFNEMPLKQKRESDWKSLELFGINNKTHYEFLKSKFLKYDIETDLDSNEYIVNKTVTESLCEQVKGTTNHLELTRLCLELANVKNRTFYENILIHNTLKESVSLHDDNICDMEDSDVLPSDLPFYTPDEMLSFGVYSKSNKFSDSPDNTIIGENTTSSKWFNNYRLLYSGITTENTNNYTSQWIQTLNELYFDYDSIKESKDVDRINARMQSILELGWNPYIDFNISNRMKANDRVRSILKEEYSNTKIVDLSSFLENHRDIISEKASELPSVLMAPIFLVFIQSDTIFNKAITAVTKGKFGHVSIGFDPSLKTLYSYNLKERGFSYESISKYTDVSKLKVFCLFTSPTTVNKIKKAVQKHADNKDNTDYGFLNLITIPLKIDYTSNTNMVCSQFVDAMLKIGDIDITKKASSLVDPNEMHARLVKNKKIYKIYDGNINKYDATKVKNFLYSLTAKMYNSIKEFSEVNTESSFLRAMGDNITSVSKLRYLSENSKIDNEEYNMIYEAMLKPYIKIQPVLEAKEFPVQFDDEGNLLIQKIEKIDFEHEYSKSHKLLLAYEKTENVDGMKYELCKLWFMNLVLEKRLYGKKISTEDYQDYNKARAKILNDFNKYIKFIIDRDSKFNFIEYYNETPFNDAKIKVNSSTLKYTIKYIKSILMG